MRLAFAHTCPHQMPMRGATATITNAKATAYCIANSPYVTSAVWGRAGTVRTKNGWACIRFTVAHYLYYRQEERLSLSHLRSFCERSRYPHDTFVLSQARRSSWPAHSHDPMRENGGGAVFLLTAG